MIELFVEKQTVDINDGFSTMLTLAIDDIKDFGAKNTTFSKTIILPGTKNNNYLFGNIFSVSAANSYVPTSQNIGYNFNPAIGASAYIFADNMQIFKGVLRMLEIRIDEDIIEYEVAVFGELGGFSAALSNFKLQDLDFSAYNHVYSYANIINRSALGTGAGYVYPMIDYGGYSDFKHDWQYKTMRPALHVKEYIDKIFASAKYTYDSALFNTNRFKSLIVPHNIKTFTKLTSSLFNMQGGNIIDNIYSGYLTLYTGKIGQFTTIDNISFFYGNATSTITNITANLLAEAYTALPNITVTLNKNGIPIKTVVVSDIGFYDLSVSNITFNLSDSFNILVTGIGSGETFTFSGFVQIDTTTPVLAPILLGDQIVINDTLPKNVLQKDFISSILKLFNLYVFEDYEKDKALKIIPFVEFYAGATTHDWSNKLDRSKPIVIKPMSELNSRYFEFNYKDDADFYNDLYKKRYNENYSSFKYDSEFEFANEVTKVELIFASTVLVGYQGEDKIYPTIFKRNGDSAAGEEQIDSVIRILQTKLITGVTSYNIENDATVLGTLTDYVYAGHLDDPDVPTNDLNFGVPKELFFSLATGNLTQTQFNVYYSKYMAEITDKDSKLLTATFRLNRKDIYQLDFSKLIYIDSNLFRINKIIDYNATKEDVCKVELLKIINRF